jgi:hypothetical protein
LFIGQQDGARIGRVGRQLRGQRIRTIHLTEHQYAPSDVPGM